MSAENVSSGGVRGVVTRRVLLAVGGLTLLAGCASAPAAGFTDAAQVHDPPGGPAGSGRTPSPRTGPSRPGPAPARRRADDKPMFYVDDAREVARHGHLIANHTWTHPDLVFLPRAAVADEMNRATAAIHRPIANRAAMDSTRASRKPPRFPGAC